MTNAAKFYLIDSYEWLTPTGDANKLLIRYSIADDDQGKQNRRDSNIVIKLSRNLIKEKQFRDETYMVKVVVAYLKAKIETAIRNSNQLPSEMSITTYDSDFIDRPNNIEPRFGEWCRVTIERKIGFLSS